MRVYFCFSEHLLCLALSQHSSGASPALSRASRALSHVSRALSRASRVLSRASRSQDYIRFVKVKEGKAARKVQAMQRGKMSRKELAEAVGVNFQTIGYLERGSRDVQRQLDLLDFFWNLRPSVCSLEFGRYRGAREIRPRA